MNVSRSGPAAERLNWLFAVVRPTPERVYTTQDLVKGLGAAVEEWGERDLATAIEELRNGRSDQLSPAQTSFRRRRLMV